MSPKKMKTALFLNPKDLAQLKKLAKKLDVSTSYLIREGIKATLRKYKKQVDKG
jgi:predicted DNA-binding protein